MANKKTLSTLISVLKHATENGVSASKAAQDFDLNPMYVSNIIQHIGKRRKSGSVSDSEYNSVMSEYNKYLQWAGSGKKKRKKMTKSNPTTALDNPLNLSERELGELEYDVEVDESYDEKSSGDVIRGREVFTDRNGTKVRKITGYKYKVIVNGEKISKGEFSREEMDAVYRLYSGMDGAGMTLKSVAREFPGISFVDFKRILKAFRITKSSLPVPPHIMEELSEDEVVHLVMKNKEHSVLKKIDSGRNKFYEKRYIETQKEILDIKSSAEWVESLLSSFLDKNKNQILLSPIKMKKRKKTKASGKKSKSKRPKNEKPTICIFGDIHYGKKCEDPVYGRGYNKDIAHERMMKIAEHTVKEAKKRDSAEIVMVCLGDIIESAMEEGMHPGHYLEMDLIQHEQVMFAITSMKEMIEYVVNNTEAKVTVCVIHGNHDRSSPGRDEDKNRTSGKIITAVLEKFLSSDRIEFVAPKNNLLKIMKGGICIFAQHGDSRLSKKRPDELINLFGEGNTFYHLLLKGHWHSLKSEEGSNFVSIQTPSVTSTDRYILDDLGFNTLPGFLIGNEPDDCYGFDYKKITLH